MWERILFPCVISDSPPASRESRWVFWLPTMTPPEGETVPTRHHKRRENWQAGEYYKNTQDKEFCLYIKNKDCRGGGHTCSLKITISQTETKIFTWQLLFSQLSFDQTFCCVKPLQCLAHAVKSASLTLSFHSYLRGMTQRGLDWALGSTGNLLRLWMKWKGV